LGQYSEAFIDSAVDGEFLYDLNDDDLKNTLGIEHRLHRKKILNCVHRLKLAEAQKDNKLNELLRESGNLEAPVCTMCSVSVFSVEKKCRVRVFARLQLLVKLRFLGPDSLATLLCVVFFVLVACVLPTTVLVTFFSVCVAGHCSGRRRGRQSGSQSVQARHCGRFGAGHRRPGRLRRGKLRRSFFCMCSACYCTGLLFRQHRNGCCITYCSTVERI
jgi:hypothetical protein